MTPSDDSVEKLTTFTQFHDQMDSFIIFIRTF
jgi:hypothetical protein